MTLTTKKISSKQAESIKKTQRAFFRAEKAYFQMREQLGIPDLKMRDGDKVKYVTSDGNIVAILRATKVKQHIVKARVSKTLRVFQP